MVSIAIDRAKYRSGKNDKTWLDNWIEREAKGEVEVTKTIGEKEITSKSHRIDPVKLFALIAANQLSFPNAQKAVEDDQRGAIGRARMIFSGVIKNKIRDGHVLKNVDGSEVPQDEAFNAYKASIAKAPKPTAPAAPEGDTAEAARSEAVDTI